jgi:MFS family permease
LTRLRHATRTTFRSLEVRNYRLYFLGQVVSVTGTWMQSVAQVWLVLKLTGSPLALGITTGLQFLPILVLGPWGGVIADRFDRRKVLIATQAADAVLALVLGVLVLLGAVQLWMVYLLALCLGLVTVVDNPSRQSFVMELVGPEDLQNGISLNSAVFTGARVLGPALAGALILTGGIATCFLVNAFSYLAVIAGLLAMRPRDLFRHHRLPRGKGQIVEGLRYVWSTPRLRWPLALMAVLYTISFNFTVLLPLLAKFSFGGGPGMYSLFFSVMAVGSLAGALTVARQRRPSSRVLAGAALAFGSAVVAVALAPIPAVALGVLPVVGFFSMVFMATGNSMMQFGSAPSMRGRVMALYAMVFLGSTPIGAPIVGWIAERSSARVSLAIGGVAAMAAACVALWVLRALGGRGRAPQIVRRLAAAEPAPGVPTEAEAEPLSA